MDAMKFLLGATAALLLGAIFVSWQGMQQGVKNASPEELEQLREQIAELREEVRKSQQAGGPQTAPPVNPEPSIEEQLAEAQRKLAAAQAAQDAALTQADLDAKLRQQEEGLIEQMKLEGKDEELRRARLISQALLVGRVSDYVDDPQYGGFITIDVLMPEQVQVGSILGIRRNSTGILYRFKVSDVSPDGAIANPVNAIGAIKPQKGDELIFPPLF